MCLCLCIFMQRDRDDRSPPDFDLQRILSLCVTDALKSDQNSKVKMMQPLQVYSVICKCVHNIFGASLNHEPDSFRRSPSHLKQLEVLESVYLWTKHTPVSSRISFSLTSFQSCSIKKLLAFNYSMPVLCISSLFRNKDEPKNSSTHYCVSHSD